MRFTPIADMIEAMFDNGADLTSVLLAVRTIEERDAERDASRFVTVTKDEKAALRAKRYRENRKQNQPKAEANDAAQAGDESVTAGRDASRDGVTDHCDLSFLLSEKDGIREEVRKKERVSVVERRASKAVSRGTRLDKSAALSSEDRKFAQDHGVSDERIDRVWAEFIDYWIGIPGSRGTKLDWSATWRNRVRAISSKQGAGSGNGISNHRADSSTRPAQTHGDAILTGMARHAARVTERQIAERRANGGVQANPDSPDAASADARTAPNDRGQYPLLTVVTGSNPRK